MASTLLPETLREALDRPDIRPVAAGVRVGYEPELPEPWVLGAEGGLVFGPAALAGAAVGEVRHALELRLLRPWFDRLPAAAGLAAARTAALFMALERPGGGVDGPPWEGLRTCGPDEAAAHWPALAGRQAGIPRDIGLADAAALRRAWPLLGPAEHLLQSGGDPRLRLDPHTGLNAYGASARPRPWAVTFASSTASSSSERGYAAAEASRVRLLQAALAHGAEAALQAEARAVRAAVAAWYGVDGRAVVLAPSGTDGTLLALAVAQLGCGERPVTSILVAPGETGRGVALAAAGRHFADETAYGSTVPAGGLVDGFRPDTAVAAVALRGPDGAPAGQAAVAAACGAALRRALVAGGHALLHVLDASKTGLSGPAPDDVAALVTEAAGRADVVVDASQARLSPRRVQGYLARGWMVIVTGSKFFTGPPFCGALLLPPARVARLGAGTLPPGLAAYARRADWPDCPAALALPGGCNAGLLLRWRAALAEMEAFAAVPETLRHRILAGFVAAVRQGVAAHPALVLLEVPPPDPPGAEAWERVCTIVSFAVRDPASGRWMDEAAARQVHGWLNAALCGALPGLGEEDAALAGRRMHIGQPVALAGPGGVPFGALRLSAGARLVSGEPSHAGLELEARLAREVADALAVLDKIGLILRHWPLLQRAAPLATYA